MRDITHKVGIKILNDEQLQGLFPAFGDLWRKIEEFRKIETGHMTERHYQDTLMYDNVFSILGGRGTGKTSVLYTLRRKLEETFSGDMVLPIIMPEIIPEECDILDWILAVIGEKLEEIEKRQKIDYSQKCHVGSTGELRKRLERICELSLSVKYNPNSEKSFYEVVSNSARQAQNAFVFAKELEEFWTELVKVLRQNNSSNSNPMIYFFFDDVDLAPERVNNLFSVVTKYLAHPNIIVIITADEKQIMEVTEINITNRMKKLPKEWQVYLERRSNDYSWMYENQKEYYRDYESAKAYLLKVLPTSTRYYLKEFVKVSEKQNFIIEEGNPMDKAIRGLLAQLYKKENESAEEKKETSFYFKFIGNSSRQMGNAYFIIRQFLGSVLILTDKVQERTLSMDKYKENLYEAIRQFIYLVLHSNAENFDAIRDEKVFTDKFFLYQYSQWDFYVNYHYLTEVYEENAGFYHLSSSPYSKTQSLDMIISLYALGFFIDRVLLLLNDKVRICICGDKQRYYAQNELADFLNENIFSSRKLVRSNMEMEAFLEHYEELLKRIHQMYRFDIHDTRNVYDYLHCFDRKQWSGNAGTIKKLFYTEREWFVNMLSLTSMVYENVYAFGKDMVGHIYLMEEELDMDFVKRVREELKETITDFICSRKNPDISVEMKKKVHAASKRETLFENVCEQFTGTDNFVLLQEVYTICKMEMCKLSETDKLTIYHMPSFCSENTQGILWDLLDNRKEVERFRSHMVNMKDRIEYRYRTFHLVTILDTDKFYQNLAELTDSEAEAYDLFTNIIQAVNGDERKIAFEKKILNFARKVKKILNDRKEDFEENEDIYTHYVMPYKELMKSVAVCIDDSELNMAIDFCIDVISYISVAEHYFMRMKQWIQRNEETGVFREFSGVLSSEKKSYYAGFYHECEKIMDRSNAKEPWIKDAFENIIQEARREYADNILE